MAATMQVRGHKVVYLDNQWVYADDKSPTDDKRHCVRCGQLPDSEGRDCCLGTLPGVRNACCGHGVEEGYIQFENGVVIRGWFTASKF